MTPTRRALGDVFDTAPNALNLVRLFLAIEVVLFHAFTLRGGVMPERLNEFCVSIGVDGFFAVSGLLITRSWLRRPQVGPFLFARARRILPGLWLTLAVTAFLIAPAAARLAGHSAPTIRDQVAYVTGNAGIRQHVWSIGDTLTGLPYREWNGALWSLEWEVYCYVAVAVLGLLGLLRPRVVLGIAVAVWSYAMVLELAGVGTGLHLAQLAYVPQRSALMFACGALLWLYRDRIVLDGRVAAACAVTLPLGVLAFDNYRLLAAPAIAYLAIWAALRLGQHERLRLRDDLSYGVYVFAFPLQQALLLNGAGRLSWAGFSLLSVAVALPVAWLSWRLVEKPAQRLRWPSRVAAEPAARLDRREPAHA
jgi:peptidoglycan/LPS O-acetylase OafA/YrhL